MFDQNFCILHMLGKESVTRRTLPQTRPKSGFFLCPLISFYIYYCKHSATSLRPLENDCRWSLFDHTVTPLRFLPFRLGYSRKITPYLYITLTASGFQELSFDIIRIGDENNLALRSAWCIIHLCLLLLLCLIQHSLWNNKNNTAVCLGMLFFLILQLFCTLRQFEY